MNEQYDRFADTLSKVPCRPQRQDSTHDQLCDLMLVANRLGMYDAADVLKIITNRVKHV